MIKVIYNHKYREIINNITGIFFPENEFHLIASQENTYRYSAESMIMHNCAEAKILIDNEIKASFSYVINNSKNAQKAVAQTLFDALNTVFGEKTGYGILTGIRPVKLVKQLFEKYRNLSKVHEILTKEYRLKSEKADLLISVYKNIEHIKPEMNKYSIYVHIPFCPSRCSYCTFPSVTCFSETDLDKYVSNLVYEIKTFSREIKKSGLSPETVYIGGGTPAVLSHNHINMIMSEIRSLGDEITEITFEAGRPDEITEEKLKVLSEFHVTRICLNSQVLSDDILSKIGRNHTVKDFINSYKLIMKSDIAVNTDLILGLPESNADKEIESLGRIISLKPDNITVHSLSIKKGSSLWGNNYVYTSAEYNKAYKCIHNEIAASGYTPYYLYRQKNTLMNSDNIGYSIKGKECRYNIFMINENQNIIGFGAGAASKIIDSGKIIRHVNNRCIEDYYINTDRKISEKIEYLFNFDNIKSI